MADGKWTVEKLQQQLLNAEKSGKFSYEELNSLWEQAKEAIESEEEAVSLYTTYIYLTRRYLNKQDPSTDVHTKMDQLFKEASAFLAECFEENQSEAGIKLEKNYAYFLYTKMKKLDQAREVWNRLLESEKGPFAWLEAISLERAYGDTAHARRLFNKALDAVTFRPHDIFAAFVQFEREEGTREDLDCALERINARVAEFNAKATQHEYFRQKQEKLHGNDRRKGKQQEKKGGDQKGKRKQPTDWKQESNQKEQKTKQKQPARNDMKMEMDEEQPREEGGTFQTSEIPIGPVIPGMEIAKELKEEVNKDQLDSSEKNEKGVKMEKQEKAEKDGGDQKKTYKRKREGSSSEKAFPYGTELEKNKLFVKQLHFGCKSTELKEFFGRFGNVMGVRIVTKWNGKSKGCAYVDFSTDEEAAAAVLGADGAEIRGRKIAVFLSKPPPKKPRMESSIGETDEKQKDNGGPTSSQQPSLSAPKQPPNRPLGHGGMFAPRALATAAGQRAGKGGRLLLPRSISKNTSDAQSSFSPVGAVTHSTEEMNLRQNNGTVGGNGDK